MMWIKSHGFFSQVLLVVLMVVWPGAAWAQPLPASETERYHLAETLPESDLTPVENPPQITYTSALNRDPLALQWSYRVGGSMGLLGIYSFLGLGLAFPFATNQPQYLPAVLLGMLLPLLPYWEASVFS